MSCRLSGPSRCLQSAVECVDEEEENRRLNERPFVDLIPGFSPAQTPSVQDLRHRGSLTRVGFPCRGPRLGHYGLGLLPRALILGSSGRE